MMNDVAECEVVMFASDFVVCMMVASVATAVTEAQQKGTLQGPCFAHIRLRGFIAKLVLCNWLQRAFQTFVPIEELPTTATVVALADDDDHHDDDDDDDYYYYYQRHCDGDTDIDNSWHCSLTEDELCGVANPHPKPCTPQPETPKA